MKTKPLYVIVSDGGDGSYYPRFTFDTEFIKLLEDAHAKEFVTWEDGLGGDGDGFHYETLNVPEECTLESLGISADFCDGYAKELIAKRMKQAND